MNALCMAPVSFFLFIFFKDVLLWTIFKVFIEFVTIFLLFYVLVFWPRGMWDLSSPTRDRACTSYTGRQSLNHWTTREVPAHVSFCHPGLNGNTNLPTPFCPSSLLYGLMPVSLLQVSTKSANIGSIISFLTDW